MFDLDKFQELNKTRGERWHKGNLDNWSLLEWCGAMAGECGEAANVAKKIRRLQIELPNREQGLNKNNEQELRDKLGTEIADTIIYGILIMEVLGLNTGEILRQVFNKKSIEYGFPELM